MLGDRAHAHGWLDADLGLEGVRAAVWFRIFRIPEIRECLTEGFKRGRPSEVAEQHGHTTFFPQVQDLPKP